MSGTYNIILYTLCVVCTSLIKYVIIFMSAMHVGAKPSISFHYKPVSY